MKNNHHYYQHHEDTPLSTSPASLSSYFSTGYPYLRSSVNMYSTVSLTTDGATNSISDTYSQCSSLLTVSQSIQCISCLSWGEGKDLEHSIKTITTCDTSDLIGQGLPDCDIKKTTSSRNIGVLLSRKSEANSTTTGNSVSSSNNCLVCGEDN